MSADGSTPLHVTYGDALAESLRTFAPHAQLVVVREALRDGPLVPAPGDGGNEAFLAMRAHHLATAHDADEAAVRAELTAAWEQIATHEGRIVLHVDERPCIDCAAFVAVMVDLLYRSGRGVERDEPTDIAIVRGSNPTDAQPLTSADVAAIIGVWRLLVAGDEAGLTLTAADLEGLGGITAVPELPGLLVRRAAGDVPLDECMP